MKLSIVILNYNVRYFLELCIKSVQAAIANIDAEIIVVDNDSEDDSCSMVKNLFPEIKLIENKENYGFSKGNNIGVSIAKGDYLCILNPDTVVAEDTFIKLLKFYENKTKIGATSCKLIDGAGRFLPESKRNVPLVNAALKKLLGNSKYYYANHLQPNDTGEIDVLVGAFMFMRTQVFNEVNGFDEDYFMYGEDIDLSYKILKAGYKNYYYGDVSIIHFKGESTLRDKNYARRFYGAMQIFYKKHFKKNILFDMLVWIGIRMVYIFRKTPVKKIRHILKYVFVSNEKIEGLELVLSKELIINKNISNFEDQTEIIFDSNTISYKEIITEMHTYVSLKNYTYKILPEKANFILGSNDSISRGDVIIFKKN